MRLQGALSPRVEASSTSSSGHPETCPHGNPIDLETARRRPAASRSRELESGSKATVLRITEEAEEDAGLLSYLEARALRPGARHDPREEEHGEGDVGTVLGAHGGVHVEQRTGVELVEQRDVRDLAPGLGQVAGHRPADAAQRLAAGRIGRAGRDAGRRPR